MDDIKPRTVSTMAGSEATIQYGAREDAIA